MRRQWIRLGVLGILSSLVYISVVLRLSRRPVFLLWGFPQADFIPFFLVHFAILFLLLLIAAWWVFQGEAEGRWTLRLILGFAVLFRLLLVPTPPILSSDIFRYVWDARVQAAGVSPYLSRPVDFATEDVKYDPLYLQQNRPSVPTIYPPLAQLAFWAVRGVVGERITGMKGLMVLADLCAVGLVIRLLSSLGLPRSRVILYAWHPLVVFECAGSGHVDALAVPLVLAAVLAWQRNQTAAVGMALGAATLVKIYPILLVPAFCGKRRWQIPAACALTIVLGYLPYVSQAGFHVLGHLPRFLADPDEVFNPSLMGLLLLLGKGFGGVSIVWVSWVGRVSLMATLLLLLRSEPDRPADLLARIWVVGTAMTLLTMTFHPWYLMWLLPYLAIQPRAAWTYLSGAIALSYLFYVAPPTVRVVTGVVEYAPFLFLLVGKERNPLAASSHRPSGLAPDTS